MENKNNDLNIFGVEEFNDKMYYNVIDVNIDNKKNNNNSRLNLMHLNARSLLNKNENLTEFLNQFNFQFDVVGVSETWLTEYNQHLVDIDGYIYNGMSRENKKGGGVGLYVKNNINYKTRHDVINNSSSNLELFGIEIINNTPTKNTIIIVIYRSPKCQV